MKTRNIKEALRRASFCLQQSGIDQPGDEAEILLAGIMKTDRLQLFLNQDRELPPEADALFQEAVDRRCRGEPAAYISGEKYFYGNLFFVNKEVLIPRPETELLIESAVEWAARDPNRYGRNIKCIDLGTGSGALAVTTALLLPGADVWAVDLSEAALQTAKLNAARHNVQERIHWYRGNYFEALDGLSSKPLFDLIISNPPYLSRSDLANLPNEVSQYEPVEALYGGEDGLDSYRLILDRLSEFAAASALLLMEAGAGQKEKIEELFSKSGLFSSITWRYDLSGWPRVIEGVYMQGSGIERKK